MFADGMSERIPESVVTRSISAKSYSVGADGFSDVKNDLFDSSNISFGSPSFSSIDLSSTKVGEIIF